MKAPVFSRAGDHLLLILSALLLLIGSYRVAADDTTTTCGAPPLNKKKDRGIFVWKSCSSNTWYLRTVAGSKAVLVNGMLVPSGDDDDGNIKIKSKLLEKGTDSVNATDFHFETEKNDVDGFNFFLKQGQEACLMIKSPADAPLHVGKHRVVFPKSISIPSLKPCIGPLLEYTFEGGFRGFLADTGKMEWHGQRGGDPSIEYSGYSEISLGFDGKSDYVLIPESTKLNMKSYTMMAWIRYVRSREFGQVIIQKPLATWLLIHQKTGKARAGGYYGGCKEENKFRVESRNPIPTKTWTHTAMTYDENTLRIYINGKLAGEGKPPKRGAYCLNDAPFAIGSRYQKNQEETNNYFKGFMDSVRVYNGALSEDEVRSEMFRQTPYSGGPLVGQVLNGRGEKDRFGNSISLSRDGMVMAIGAPQSYKTGYVIVNRCNPATQQWTRIGQRLFGQAGGDQRRNIPGDGFGDSVSLNGDGTVVAAAARYNDNGGTDAGHVRVFEYNIASDRWVQLGSDIEGQTGDRYGFSTSLSDAGDILAVLALYTDNGAILGPVRLFRYDGDSSSWNQLGQTLTAANSAFGRSVSLSRSGTIVAIGAASRESDGLVSVFEYNPSSSKWDPLGDPIIGKVPKGEFGRPVSLDDSGLIMAVAARGSHERVFVYRYDRSTSTWTQRGQTLFTQQRDDEFGKSVSLSGNGNVLVIGSRFHDFDGMSAAGQVQVFLYNSNANKWKQLGNPLYGLSKSDYFGSSVSLSADGSVFGVGAPGSNANGSDSGSAYAFTLKNQ